MTPPEPYIVRVPAGKANDVVALFKRAPASKINNSNLANSAAGETWQNISMRTGVSVADLMAANPGMAIPRGKVFVPVKGNNVNPIVIFAAHARLRQHRRTSGDKGCKGPVRRHCYQVGCPLRR